MKRFFGLLLITIISLNLVACGEKKDACITGESASESADVTEATESVCVSDTESDGISTFSENQINEADNYNSPALTDESDISDELENAEAGADEALLAYNGDIEADSIKEADIAEASKKKAVTKGTRDNTPKVLTPTAPGTAVKGNSYVTIDISNASEGYIFVTYLGSSGKVKFQLTGNDGVTYTYNLQTNVATVLPLQAGTGNYALGCYENISGNQYAAVYNESVSMTVTNTFGPYLYPNQYVNFNNQNQCVTKAQELVKPANNDLDAVGLIYSYVVGNVAYDYDKAANVKSGYLPNVDTTLTTGKGICFDYAALMTSMLRSQGIPTRLVIGYADDAYHAWISVYITDEGWVDDIIYFDGKNWILMDPTFAANTASKDSLKKFIGNGNNYQTVYIY